MPDAPLPPSARPSGWEGITVALVAVNLGWTTLCLGGYRAETQAVTLTLTAVLVAVQGAQRAAGHPDRLHPAGWWLLPFAGYAGWNAAQVTPVPWLGWRDVALWLQLAAVFWIVLSGVHTRIGRGVLLAAVGGLAVAGVGAAAYQRWVDPAWLMLGGTQAPQYLGRSAGFFGTPNHAAALWLMTLPAAALVAGQARERRSVRLVAGLLAAVLALGLWLTISRGAWLALAGAAVLAPLAGRGPWARRWRRCGGVALAGLVVGTAVFFSSPQVRSRLVALKSESGERTRPFMWRGAWRLMLDAPVVGTGAGSFDVLFDRHREAAFQDRPGTPHNDTLHLLSDYGAVGLVLAGLGVGGIVAGCRRSRRSAAEVAGDATGRALATGLTVGLGAWALHLQVDFGLKQPALTLAGAIAAALVVQRAWPESGRGAPPVRPGWLRRAAAGLTVVGAVAVGPAWIWPVYRAEAWRHQARREIDRTGGRDAAEGGADRIWARAREALARAVHSDPRNAEAWSDLAYATSLTAHAAPGETARLGREAERCAREALALTEVVPEYWIRLGVALDMQGQWVEAGRPFLRALELAPRTAGVWYHQAVHLSRRPPTRARALAAADQALKLSPGLREAQVLRQKLALALDRR